MWRWKNTGFTLHRTEKSSQLEAIGKISSFWRCTFLDTHLFWKGKGSHSSWSIIFLPHFFVCKTTLIKTWDSLAFILLKAFLWVAEVRITIYNRQIISFLCGLLVFSVFFCNRHFLSFWCIFPAVFWKQQRWGWHFTTDISCPELSGNDRNDILSTQPPIPSIGKYLRWKYSMLNHLWSSIQTKIS